MSLKHCTVKGLLYGLYFYTIIRTLSEKGRNYNSLLIQKFQKNIEQLLEIEAILSEIQFYLEEINLESADTNNVISQIETEYLVDYYYKIGNADKEGNFLLHY